jgi:hypothetical protein
MVNAYRPPGDCHPLAYGAAQIAGQYEAAIEKRIFLLHPFLYKSVYIFMSETK